MLQIREVIEEIIKELEGVFSDDPYDTGGITVYGISRKFNPTWEGWGRVDAILKSTEGADNRKDLIVDAIESDGTILTMAANHLKVKYYDGSLASTLKEPANWVMYDMNINMGIGGATRALQKALNFMGESLAEDGAIGPNTRRALGRHLESSNFCANLRTARYARYSELAVSQPHYLRGWINRCVKFNKWLDNFRFESNVIVNNPETVLAKSELLPAVPTFCTITYQGSKIPVVHADEIIKCAARTTHGDTEDAINKIYASLEKQNCAILSTELIRIQI